MFYRFCFFLILAISITPNSMAQSCPISSLGQNPSTAFPVCGTATFAQAAVPICGNTRIPCPCTGTLFTDKNPYWYKFTCFTGGTLGFIVSPINGGDDYDWQVFDITNHNPNDVYTDGSLFVCCNWSSRPGNTGTSANSNGFINCEGPSYPNFSNMPNLIVGHTYLLLVSHFTDSQVGYALSFGGGTANITDPAEPHILSAKAACDGTQATIKINKRMKCSSLTLTGSEFSISPPISTVIAASGFGCAGSFDMDSIVLTLNNPLPPGNYTITINNGTDGNTLKDNCDRLVPPGENVPLPVYPIIPTPMDSLTPVKCAPDELLLVFKKNIRCNSLAADGSDFFVTGPANISVSTAAGNCINGLSNIIKVKLNAAIQTAGNYQIHLQTGTDGNTIIDECGQETPPGAILNFTTADTVNANFTYILKPGCKRDTIDYFHNGANGINKWSWDFGDFRISSQQNPVMYYSGSGPQTVQLVVSNGVCTASGNQVITLAERIKAGFETVQYVCPGDLTAFKDTSKGNPVAWNWNFGNNNTSALQSPPAQIYPYAASNYFATIRLIATNALGCNDTISKRITVLNNCYIAVPNAFTPNGDGFNDYLYPLNAYKAIDLNFSVYSRFGQLLFYTTDWTVKWDGIFKGQPQEPGTYVWILQYTNMDTRKRVEQKGSTVLIR
jgi:gliding motility-associated-like protein